MRRLVAFAKRLRDLFGFGGAADRDFSNELESHLQMHMADNLRSGMTPERARREALMKLGGVEQTKQSYRQRRGLPLIETLAQDLRYAVRSLRKNPGFALVAVLTLALGIGANTAIFSVVNGVILKPLPFPNPDRLVGIFLHGGALERNTLGTDDFLALQKRQQTFDHVAGFSPSDNGVTLTGLGVPQMVPGMYVTADFFAVLGVQPILGRTFLPEEGTKGGNLAVVVSRRFWEQHLHGDSGAIGQRITVDGKSFEIVGVLPLGFSFGPSRDLWPVMQLAELPQRPPYFLFTIGRLKPGVTSAQGAADASRIAKQLQEEFPNSDLSSAVLMNMREMFSSDVSQALFILLGAVGFVLLIAVVNVANLQLSRAASRGREMAIRSALGAGSRRLIMQMLTESLLLAALGAVLGLLIAHYAIRAILTLGPDVLPRSGDISLDGSVLFFTAAVTVVAGIVFGLAPALRAAASPTGETLKEAGRGLRSSRGTRRLHSTLVVAEFALALVVLTGAGLLIRTLFQLQAVNPGFGSSRIFTALISLPWQRYETAPKVVSFYEQMLQRLKASPGIENAGVAMSLPPNLLQLENPFHLEGETLAPGQTSPIVPEIPISADYFATLGVPLLRGRAFTDADRAPGAHVLIISQAMAERYFGGEAVGKRVQTGDVDPKADWYTIVGVVGDVKYEGLDREDEVTMYVPYYDSGWCPWFSHALYLVVRTKGAPENAANAMQSAVWSLDNQLPLSHLRTMDRLLYDSVSDSRFRAILFAAFAALALVLAMIGIFGVMAYSVSQRANEIAIRMALGAQRSTMMNMILGQSARLAALGVTLGLVASLALAGLLKKLLFGVQASDPVTLCTVAALALAVALLAGYLPARRAMRVDPIVVLRYE